MKILLIEDNPADARLIKEMLIEVSTSDLDYTCVERLSEGLECLAGEAYDAVLLDLGLPDSQGLETFRRVHAGIPQIPIIILTGLDDEKVALEAVSGGAQDYMVKGRVDGTMLMRTIRYASERKRAEKELKRINRTLRALSDCNQVLVHATDETSLLEKICRVIVDIGGYRFVWVGFTENDENKTVRPVAKAGYEEGYLDTVKVTWADTDRGRGPTGTAIRTRKAYTSSNVRTDLRFGPWHDEAVKRGFNSVMSAPLIADDCTLGAITIYSSRVDAFDPEEAKLMNEMADELAYGIVSLRNRSERIRAEKELQKRTHDLGERAKELHCLYNVSKIAEDKDMSLEETIQRIVNLIPPAWQYPEITCARIFLQEKEFKTKDFKTSVWKQTSDISVYGKIIGTVEAYYTEEQPTDFEGPFMKEERDLVEAISERLGRIIERKQAEEEKQKIEAQLVQAQKMEAIGTLAGGIAHDFNNILSAVIGYTQISLDQAEKGTLLKRNLDEVLKAGIRAKNLIQQILTFSRQSDQGENPVYINLLAKEVLNLLKASLPSTIEIRQRIQSNSAVLSDPTQIHQVLMNLCTNAGYAMRENGGVLEVSLTDEELEADFTARHGDLAPGPYIKLTVGDAGHGMPPEVLEKIFDPYFTTKEVGEGTGMGLSVVHGIVKNCGGTITVYSELGEGTTFNVFLPIIETKTEPQIAAEKPLPTGTERILFVDDEETLVDLGRQMLERLGYEVVTGTSSIDSLELFKTRPDNFDLIITDMTMPNMTGDKLAREVMEIRSNVPIILCTGFSARISEERAKEMGIKAFVMKPLLIRDLANTVRKVLDAGRSEV